MQNSESKFYKNHFQPISLSYSLSLIKLSFIYKSPYSFLITKCSMFIRPVRVLFCVGGGFLQG